MRGVYTALVTPFLKTGEIDWDSYRAILRDQRDAGLQGVIPCGTTGESPTLTVDEKKKLITVALEELKGSKCSVIAGTGSNDTRETVLLSRWASDAGAAAVLIVTPYYSKPSQAGLEAHFRAVADAVSCEVILYNVPGRTGVSLTAATVARLAIHPRIRSVKEATGNTALTSDILDAVNAAGTKIDVLSGDDGTYLPLLAAGAVGVISVASNLFPRALLAIQNAMDEGHPEAALKIHHRYFPLFRDLFVESNPVPIKAAMEYAGWCGAELRLPLVALAPANREVLMASLQKCGIKKGKTPQ